MTVALEQRRSNAERGRWRLFEPGGDRTLERAISTLFTALDARADARCLVCGAALSRGEDEAVRCEGCGSTLE